MSEACIARYQNTVLIYNPVAGKLRGSGLRIINRAVEELDRQGIKARVVPTHGPGTATQIAEQAVRDDVDLVLVAGGDGTINEVANGMMYSQVPLGILPAGTANVLAVELGMGTRIRDAVRAIPQCVPERISVGRVKTNRGSRFFLLMAGIGLDAHIVYNLNPGLKAFAGKLAYWIGGFGRLSEPVGEFETVVNGRVLRCGFVLASRVKNYGGDLTIAPNASLLEHDFQVVLFEGRNPFRYLFYFLGVLLRILPTLRGINIERATTLELRAPTDSRIYVQVDGEFAGHLPADVEIVESALTLLLPADARQRLGIKVTEALMPAAGD